MMFNFDEETGQPKDVKFLDYQMMALSHPARYVRYRRQMNVSWFFWIHKLLFSFFRDLCYFLYVNTNRAFRDKYLDLCLRSYYAAFSQYFSQSFLRVMNYEKFEKEFQDRRIIGLVWGLLVMPNVLSPNPRKFETFKEFNDLNKIRHVEIASVDKPEEDHKMITEIRDRIIEMVQEFIKLDKL